MNNVIHCYNYMTYIYDYTPNLHNITKTTRTLTIRPVDLNLLGSRRRHYRRRHRRRDHRRRRHVCVCMCVCSRARVYV